MQLTIKIPQTCPIGAKPDRRVIGSLDFAPRGTGALSSYTIQRSKVSIDERRALLIEASYTPINHVLNILTEFQTGSGETHVFGAVCELGFVPTWFCFRLPDGDYVEYYLQADAP